MDIDVALYRSAIIQAFPDLAASNFRVMTAGWHSVAVDVDDRLIFKFPRHEIAQQALLREASLLALIRHAVSTAVPDLVIHEGPLLFSRHEKLKGEHLLAADYVDLPEEDRQRLGEDLARFYAELHRLEVGWMTAAGAGPIEPWQTVDAIRARALPMLECGLRMRAEEIVAVFERLPPDPHGMTYGFFDGHGWNMAFDHDRGRLSGVYDFADSGIGPLHQELIYSNFISPDLTERVITGYEARTGREIDRRRVAILTGVHRLSELAGLADDPEHAPTMVRYVAEWDAVPDRL